MSKFICPIKCDAFGCDEELCGRYKAYQHGRKDGIEDFVKLINEMPTYENEYGEIMPMPVEMMAEQLKH